MGVTSLFFDRFKVEIYQYKLIQLKTIFSQLEYKKDLTFCIPIFDIDTHKTA